MWWRRSRSKIYQTTFWKWKGLCFGLTAETLVDKSTELDHLGGFLLVWYVRILGAFDLRLTGTDLDAYLFLEPLYYDYRK